MQPYWQIAATVAAILFPLLGLLNAYLLNQLRLGIADLKVQILEARVADAKELRAWAESNFVSKGTAEANREALSTRIGTLEARRRVAHLFPSEAEKLGYR